jgi:hypothetical protein
MTLPTLPDQMDTSKSLASENPYEITIQYKRRSRQTGMVWQKLSSNYLFYLLFMTAYMLCFHFLGKLFSMPITMTLLMCFVALSYLRSIILACAPHRIQIGQSGMRFQWLYSWPFTFSGSSGWIPWTAIEGVDLKTKNKGKQHIEIAIEKSAFETAFQGLFIPYCTLILQLIGIAKNTNIGTNFIIDVNGIFHEPDKAKLYSALTHFLSSEQLDPSMAALQPLGYTKLWLREFAERGDAKNSSIDPLSAGTELADGRFKILERLGSGGQSLTYAAKILKISDSNHVFNPLVVENSDNAIVLKEFVLPVRAGIEIKRRALKHIENEARLLQNLDHPQIVKYIDSFVSGQRAYLALEHVTGVSLRKLVATKGPLNEIETVKIAISMCSILEYLHGLNPPIIHRDFTPENLLLNDDGKLVLIDFNVAQQQELASTRTVVGKHNYLPPEQFRGNATTQSDIYACGGSIFWLCTGQDPLPLTISHPQITISTVGDKLDAIVAKATNLQLTDRYKSAAELRKDLEMLL